MQHNREEKVFYTLFLVAVVAIAAAASAATPPANLSLRGIAEWTIGGGHISSGTGALPAVGAAGERYTDISTPTAPVDYRSDGISWRVISGGSGGTGTTDHAALSNLDYAGSGHTGFAATSDLDSYQPVASMADYALDSDLDAHTADQTDPHGASMTVSQSLVVGNGTAEDVYYERISTGVARIASFVVVPPEATAPASLATGTLWFNSGTGKLCVYTGSAWADLH